MLVDFGKLCDLSCSKISYFSNHPPQILGLDRIDLTKDVLLNTKMCKYRETLRHPLWTQKLTLG